MILQCGPLVRITVLQEFLAIQNQQPRSLGFFGTRNMGFMHQQLIEVLAYAMLLTVSTGHAKYLNSSRSFC